MRIFALFLVLCSCQIGEAMSRASLKREVNESFYSVGVQTLEYFDQSRSRPVVIEFWYPTTQYDEERGRPVRNGEFLENHSKMPLIMMSHGHRGCRTHQSWLAIEMVKRGYFVASVEHYGSAKESFHPIMSLKFWDRFKDVSFGLDQIMQRFGSRIDGERIGFIGYSMGGMTGLGLAGAKAQNVKEIVMREYQSFKGFTEEMVAQVDFEAGEQHYGDARIKSMLLLCPANFIYPAESLRKVKIPIALVAAFHDEVLPHKDHAYPIICHLVPKKMKVIREKVSHTFLSLDPNSEGARNKFHQEIVDFAIEFFRSNL